MIVLPSVISGVISSSLSKVFDPKKISGLALWLKADAGVTRFQSTYVSQIILTCTGGLSSYSGTYIATSTPDADGVYTLFCSANSKTILKESFDDPFIIQINNVTLASSGDGISWSFQNILVAGLTISGATGSYTGANGVYLFNERNQSSGDIYRNNENGYYGLVNTNGVVEIYSPDFILIYSNSSFGSGAWTNHGGGDFPEATGTVTATSIQLDPSGTVSGSITTSSYATSNVTAWADQSGNGNNATSPTIAPTFVSSSINNRPAISFNGDESWMQVPQNSIGNSGNISIFVVLNYASGLTIFNKGDLATYEATAWEITTSNGFGFVNPNEGDPFWNVVPISIATNTPVLLEAFSSAGVSQIAFNGTDSGSPSGPNSEFNNISQYLGIGAGGDGGGTAGNPLDARIAEIIIYNRQVTTPERQQVEAYLNSKYAIY